MSRATNVRHFHTLKNQPVRGVPAVCSDDEMRFRLRLDLEEFFEELEACFENTADESELLQCARDDLESVIDSGRLVVDLPALADALEDRDYVTEGFRAYLGIDGEAIHAIVHAKNMEKIPDPGCKKAIKPPGWTPPDIRAELIRQGWTPPK